MLQKLIEELEVILTETNQVKQNLNRICDKTWYLLSPPGRDGTFRLTRSPTRSFEKPSCSIKPEIKEPSAIEDILGNVSDLIALGKHVREASSVENVRKNRKGDAVKNQIYKESSSKLREEKTSIPTQSHKPENRSYLGCKSNETKKLQNTKNTQDSVGSIKECQKKNTHTNMKDHQKITSSSESSTIKPISTRYHHTCSMSFKKTAKTPKIPSELMYLLKLYDQFENNKLNKCQHDNNFSEKFYNHVKAKFERNLKNNSNQEERCVKYIDISGGMNKSQDSSLLGKLESSRVQYQSLEQLYTFEARYQRLMELKLHNRLLSVLNKTD